MSGERILVVAPYAPYRDGIAAYAVQQVKQLRAAGNHVEVLSPHPSAAHHHLDFFALGQLRKLATVARSFDRVVLHFHPAVLFPQPITLAVRLRYFLALGAVLRQCPPTTMVLHEINRQWATAGGASRRLASFLLGSFACIEVHDQVQAQELREVFGVPAERVAVIDHGAHFFVRTRRGRAEARQHLGVGDDEFTFVCIGFVAEHKGFDRAVRALARLRLEPEERKRVRLDIVGSPSPGSEPAQAHARDLQELVAATPGAQLHGGFVSDASFDEWLLAADLVLLPYRLIWSSSVLERAVLLGRPVVASAVGGLAERLASVPEGRSVRDDGELLAAMQDALTAAGFHVASAELDQEWKLAPDEVADEVRRRATEHRGYALRDEPSGTRVAGSAGTTGSARLAALRRIGPLARPIPVSARPGVTFLKRLERRLLDWELGPLIHWVDEIRRGTLRALEDSGEETPPGR